VELAAIETTVNRLLDRVEKAFEKERRFSSDLAHELRTPIAELRTACEVGGQWPEDVEQTKEFFQDAGMIALQLEKIVSTMLMLSRCENGTVPMQTRRIPLQAFVRECWRHSAPAAEAKRLQFDDRIALDLAVECDEDKLGIIVRNLVENAVAHGEPGTVVECSGGATPGGTELRLVNAAKDLERSDLDHVFDRFWRKDAARSDRSHIGLGLSIARELSELMGIRLSVDLREGRLFEVRLVFPEPTSTGEFPVALRKS
jgi:signal transduction histidine kinase